MPNWIKPDRIKFKLGSFEWLNFFGVPSFLILISLISLYVSLKDNDNGASKSLLLVFVVTMIIGITTYIIQHRRLKYKTFQLTKSLTEFKENTRKLLHDNKWEIEYDNQNYLQATYRGSIFNLDLLTLRFKKTEIQWNLIHHPDSHNSIAALLSMNRPGRRIIKKIITSACSQTDK